MQGSGNIRAPSSAPAGSTVNVEVAGGSSTVQVSTGGSETTDVTVNADGTASIQIPAGLPAGSFVSISVGKGLNKKVVLIEIVETQP